MFFSLKNRLLLIFTGLLTVPFIILSILIPSWLTSIIREQTQERTMVMMEQFSFYFQSIADQAENLGKQTLINQTTQAWLKKEKELGAEHIETVALKRELKALLSSMIINNSQGMSVSIILEDGSGMWVNQEFVNELDWLDNMYGVDRFIAAHLDVDQPSLEMREQPVNSYILPLFDINTLVTRGVIKVNIPSHLLKDALDQVTIGENGGAFVVNGMGENLLSGKVSSVIQQAVKEIEGRSEKKGFIKTEENGEAFLLFYQSLPINEWVLINQVKESDLFGQVNQLQRHLFLASGVLFVITVIASYLLSSTIVQPLGQLAKAMKYIETGDFNGAREYMPSIKSRNNEVSYLIKVVERTVTKLKRLIDTEYEANIRRKDAEYKALLLQINPHFLNNTLEIISGLAAQGKNEEVMNISSYLGKMLSYSLNTKQTLVTLGDEANYISNYRRILKLRYEEALKMEMEMAPEVMTNPIIKFVLQPLVENAVKYSFIDDNEATIYIEMKKSNENVVITIKDKGTGMKPELVEQLKQKEHEPVSVLDSQGKSIGLRNVIERLKIYYGSHFQFEIESQLGNGTKITLSIPFTREEETG
ncbi:two-component system, sensor histidine kinase YesM [Evansella caseinilytica]|uniref:histidine kinase n=1 Tax=Evansella caseinilytica TaxID=1503961 RepID=A0A1H3UU76_9BACI|nr:sensor histidine kinase [Evansella caseinilytica]SDZ65349.1 two-component system, sensor histidine kinase YesM [Evansella caseinilytica]